MEKFEALEKKMCQELEAIEQKLKSGAEMSETDLKRADLLAHTMKSLATYKAMKDAEEYEMDDVGMSGSRGRPSNGRYVSRAYGPEHTSYDDGMSGRCYPPNGYPMRGPNW